MTKANLKKLKVRINETNDDTPKKVRRLVNRCRWEKKLLKLFQGWVWEIDVEKKRPLTSIQKAFSAHANRKATQ